MNGRLGFAGRPRTVGRGVFHRLDLAPPGGPYRTRRIEGSRHEALAGFETGDLVLAKNKKAQSLGSCLTLAEFAYYDHMGVLAFENGRAYVYEAWPRIDLVSRAPDFASRFTGGVFRTPFSDFAVRYETLEVVRLPDAERNAAAARAARGSLAEDIDYDPHHDPEDPRLSCSEYILYLFEEHAGYDLAIEPIPMAANPSLRELVASLGFHTRSYVVPDAFLEVEGARSAGVLSRHPTAGELLGSRAAFQALHAHFAAHSEVGSYLAFHPTRLLRYRANVEAFLGWARAYGATRAFAGLETVRGDLERLLPTFFVSSD